MMNSTITRGIGGSAPFDDDALVAQDLDKISTVFVEECVQGTGAEQSFDRLSTPSSKA
jgi:hypothetical protein